MELSKEQIRRLAVDDSTYNRGVRYYKAKAVTNVTWSKGLSQYQAVVHGGNDYRVTIRLKEDGSFHYNCNCSSKVKYRGACKHIIATLLFLSDYLRMKKDMPQEKEDMAAFRIVHYFEKHEELPVYGETFDALATVCIEEASGVFAFASFQFGAGRMYKIQNLKKFLEKMYSKQEISIGKSFRYVPEESSFTAKAERLLHFLLEIYEIQEAEGNNYFSKTFSKSQISLSESMFYKLMECLDGQPFTLELIGENGETRRCENVTFKKENPAVSFEILESEEELYLTYKEKSDLIMLAGNKKLFFNGETIFSPSQPFLKTFLPFYTELKKQEMILFRGQYKEHFISNVLLHLYEQTHMELPLSLQGRYIREELNARAYVDREGADISLLLEFHYGTHKINPLAAYDGGYIVLRDIKKEQKILDLLNTLSFLPYQDHFLMREEAAVYYFLSEGCQALAKDCELFYTDEVKKISRFSMPAYKTLLRIDETSDLLELTVESDEFLPEDLKLLFYSMKMKKKYHRLKNGNFLKLETPELQKLQKLLDSLEISWQKIQDNTIRMDKSKAFYLDEIFDTETEKSDSFRRYVQNLLGEGWKQPGKKIPEIIHAHLREYQKQGFAWMKLLAEHSLGGILADDMGLGKTLQAITYISDRMEQLQDTKKTNLYLIVCPSSLIYNWQEEFLKFAPGIKTYAVRGTPKERADILKAAKDQDVLITSYPLLRNDIDKYKELFFDSMFIDEAQYIKNPGSLSSRMVKRVRARHKFALTGTPIENSLGELWSIFNFIMPEYLPRYSKFQDLYEKPIVNEKDSRALHELEKRIRPFLLRRMKKEVLDELPDKIELKYTAEMTKEQNKLYQSYLYMLRDQIYGKDTLIDSSLSDDVQEMPLSDKLPNRLMILSALTRLRQICCHPSSFLEDYHGGSGKYSLLMEELLPDLLKSGHRILIFSQFTSILEIIAAGLEKQGIGFYRLEGSTTLEERRNRVEAFNRGGHDIFLISLKAGGTGLNLTGADTVIHFDPWWNPAVEEQAEDRAYRIGQEKNVQVLRLITRGTIEEKIYELQKKKQELSDRVISAQDLKELFDSDIRSE